jgi:UDP-glucuronate 4-epimerase
MKIVVTGAAGFIGSHTCEALVARGHEVVGVDSFDSYLYPAEVKRKNAAELTATLSSRHFSLVEADICDQDAMSATIDGSVEVILHLAALAGVRPSLREPLRYIRANLRGTMVLLERCHELELKRFVFASSSSVYGARGADAADLSAVAAFREDDPCLHPASPYAATKRSGELLCSSYRDLYGIGISALRFFTVYGPRQRPDMAIHRFARAILDGAPLTLYGDGSTSRDYTYVGDVIGGILGALSSEIPHGVYNIGNSVQHKLTDVVALLEQALGKRAKIEHLPEQPGDPPHTCADITAAKRDLGYDPVTEFTDGVRRFVDWLG